MALKTGSEDRKKVIIAAVLGLVVLALVGWDLVRIFGNGTPPPPLPPQIANSTGEPSPKPEAQLQTQSQATTPQPAPATTSGHEAQEIPGSLARLDPTLHPEWMAAAESLKYEGNGRNIFSMSSVPVHIEKPIGPIRPGGAHAVQVAQGPPAPPAIDLKFFGYESHPDGQRKAFLLHGDDVFIASQGDVVDHRYKIVSIAPLSITIEDIPYNDTQTLPLIQN